jgi:hypothetical protein
MRWIYYRILYRPLMRLAHRFNWHHCDVLMPTPYEGVLHWCHWCGLRYLDRTNERPPK